MMSGKRRTSEEADLEVQDTRPLSPAIENGTGAQVKEEAVASADTKGAKKGRGFRRGDNAADDPLSAPRGAFFMHDDRFAPSSATPNAEEDASAASAKKPIKEPRKGRAHKLWDPFDEGVDRWSHDKFDERVHGKAPIETPISKRPPAATASSTSKPATDHKNVESKSTPAKTKIFDIDKSTWGDMVEQPAQPPSTSSPSVPPAPSSATKPATATRPKKSENAPASPAHPKRNNARPAVQADKSTPAKPTPARDRHAKSTHSSKPGEKYEAAAPPTATPRAPTTSSHPVEPKVETSVPAAVPEVVMPPVGIPPPAVDYSTLLSSLSQLTQMPPMTDVSSQYGPGAVVTPTGLVIYPTGAPGFPAGPGGMSLVQSPTGEFIPTPMLPFFPQMPLPVGPPGYFPPVVDMMAAGAPTYGAPLTPSAHGSGTNVHAAEYVPSKFREQR